MRPGFIGTNVNIKPDDKPVIATYNIPSIANDGIAILEHRINTLFVLNGVLFVLLLLNLLR